MIIKAYPQINRYTSRSSPPVIPPSYQKSCLDTLPDTTSGGDNSISRQCEEFDEDSSAALNAVRLMMSKHLVRRINTSFN